LAKLLQGQNIFQVGLQNFCKGKLFFMRVGKTFARAKYFSGGLAKLLQWCFIFVSICNCVKNNCKTLKFQGQVKD